MATYEEAVAAVKKLRAALAPYPALLVELEVVVSWSTWARDKLLFARAVRDKVIAYVLRLKSELTITSSDQAVSEIEQALAALVDLDSSGDVLDFDAEAQDALAHFALTHPNLAATVSAYIERLKSAGS